MVKIKKIDEIISKLDEFRCQIEELKGDVEFNDIATDEEARKVIEKHSILQNLASFQKLVFTVNDLTKIFQVTSRTIYNWKEQGRLSFVQINSKTYVTSGQLDDFLKLNEVKSLKFGRNLLLTKIADHEKC